LNGLRLRGARARPMTFQPAFHKHAGRVCSGVQIHVTDAATFRPMATYLALIALAHRQAPDRFSFRTDKYEFREDVHAFDLLSGSPDARLRIAHGDRAIDVAEEIVAVDDVDRAIVAAAIDAARARAIP
ncbi:MAG: DUF1343 domain-containing protein, partial [Myxococcota bacterium]|nr:DUF1343 domain-containing protein [Myxococcota bacterium]